MKFIKLYHYSSSPNLEFVDPVFYGTGAARGSECKHGKTGLNKSYFYTENKPEPCVKSLHLYEIYIPYEWKSLIYDRSIDPLSLYETVKSEIKMREKREPYEYELKDSVEKRIFDLGFKGWRSSASPQLSHAIILFEKVSTAKPSGHYVFTHLDEELTNENSYRQATVSLKSSQGCIFFQQKQIDNSTQLAETTIIRNIMVQ